MNLVIDNSVNNIIYNNHPVQKLIYNGAVVWEKDYSKEYLTFEITTAGTIGWKNVGGIGVKTIQYSINNGAWTNLSTPSTADTAVYIQNLKVGDKVRLKGTNNTYATTQKIYAGFDGGTARYNIYGNIMSLIGGDNFQTTTSFTGTYNVCSMFKQSGAVNAENLILPVLTLTEGCYRALFSKATHLTVAPKIFPATTLATYCYWYMFENCLITRAPEMPYDGAVSTNGYGYMFVGCTNLNYIKCLATNISATDATTGWTKNVAASGTFIKNANMSSWTRGINGIPTGWTVEDYVEPQPQPTPTPTPSINGDELKLQFSSNGTLGLLKSEGTNTNSLEYSKNGADWNTLSGSNTISVSNGDYVYLRGNIKQWYDSSNAIYLYLNCTATISKASGNLLSVYDKNNYQNRTSLDNSTDNLGYIFYNTNLIDASELELNLTTLTDYCYRNLFFGCSNLTGAPALPATTLVNSCYQNMFFNCSSLVTAPTLPATTLAISCYYSMFRNCISLVTAPELLATTLPYGCYQYMFYGCSNLNYIKCLATTDIGSTRTSSWVYGVANNGTFVKASSATWSTGNSAIPTGWTVQDA